MAKEHALRAISLDKFNLLAYETLFDVLKAGGVAAVKNEIKKCRKLRDSELTIFQKDINQRILNFLESKPSKTDKQPEFRNPEVLDRKPDKELEFEHPEMLDRRPSAQEITHNSLAKKTALKNWQ